MSRPGDTRHRKIPVEARKAIRDRYRAGETCAQIAKDYGVGSTAIQYHVADIGRPLKGCGTRAGFRHHKDIGGIPCQPCVEANRAYMRAYAQKRKEAA